MQAFKASCKSHGILNPQTVRASGAATDVGTPTALRLPFSRFLAQPARLMHPQATQGSTPTPRGASVETGRRALGTVRFLPHPLGRVAV